MANTPEKHQRGIAGGRARKGKAWLKREKKKKKKKIRVPTVVTLINFVAPYFCVFTQLCLGFPLLAISHYTAGELHGVALFW
jgi:hypothetical protein